MRAAWHLVKDRIERHARLSLIALRGLYGKEDAGTAAFRKYLFGLSLVAATADIELFPLSAPLRRELRRLVRGTPAGEPILASLTPETVLAYAKAMAQHVRSRWPEDAKLKHELGRRNMKR